MRSVNSPTTGRRLALLALGLLGLVVLLVGTARTAAAQAMETITLDEAVRRALDANPRVQQAAAGDPAGRGPPAADACCCRFPTLDAALTTTVIGPVPEFGGQSVVPRSQLNTTVALSAPLIAPVQWAQRNQAVDQVTVSMRASDDARRASPSPRRRPTWPSSACTRWWN